MQAEELKIALAAAIDTGSVPITAYEASNFFHIFIENYKA